MQYWKSKTMYAFELGLGTAGLNYRTLFTDINILTSSFHLVISVILQQLILKKKPILSQTFLLLFISTCFCNLLKFSIFS